MLANESQIARLCELSFKDKGVASRILASVRDGKPGSEKAADALRRDLEKNPEKVGSLKGNALIGKDRERAIAAAATLGKAVQRRADLLVASDRCTVLWQKSVAALKLSPDKQGTVLEDLKSERDLLDTTLGGRIDTDADRTIDIAIEMFGSRAPEGKVMGKGRADDDTMTPL